MTARVFFILKIIIKNSLFFYLQVFSHTRKLAGLELDSRAKPVTCGLVGRYTDKVFNRQRT